MKILNQQIIKTNNLRKVFSLILNRSPVSRIELADITRLSKTTISALVDELITKGFVVDEGAVDTGRQGRKPNQLRVNHESNVVAVINWHIEELEVSLVDLAGDIAFRVDIPVSEEEDFPRLIRSTYDGILCREAAGRRILGFCLIVPSMLDPVNKRMISTTLPVPMESDVLDQICRLFTDIPMAVFNDTACYAYAEKALTKMDTNTFTFININKGVGAIIVSNGVMIQGEGGMRSQLGHYSLHRDGEPCICGNRGCLENEIGESALVKRARRMGVYEAIAQDGHITFELLGRQADSGNPAARRFVEELADDLAYTLGNLFTVYNTSHVIIGGRGQNLGSHYLQELDKRVKAVGFKAFVENIKTRYTALGDDAIMRGAARYFIDKYYDFLGPMQHLVVLE